MSVEATSGAGAPGLPMNTSVFGKTQKQVLVIDDTQDIRFIISETLNLFGFHTLTAEDLLLRLAKDRRVHGQPGGARS